MQSPGTVQCDKKFSNVCSWQNLTAHAWRGASCVIVPVTRGHDCAWSEDGTAVSFFVGRERERRKERLCIARPICCGIKKKKRKKKATKLRMRSSAQKQDWKKRVGSQASAAMYKFVFRMFSCQLYVSRRRMGSPSCSLLKTTAHAVPCWLWNQGFFSSWWVWVKNISHAVFQTHSNARSVTQWLPRRFHT